MVGLADAADRRVGAYSKGMGMRLNFVRALLHDPDIVFLDEPTSGIDPGNARVVKDAIAGLADDGKTVFLTTHDMTVADELCDRVAFLVDGRMPLVDAPESLKRQHGSRTLAVTVETDAGTRTDRFELDGLDADAAFQRLLADERVETMHTEEATLEDVFLEVTGSNWRDRSLPGRFARSALAAMLAWDVCIQARYGFYAVYAVVTGFYLVVLDALPASLVDRALVLVVVTDTAVLGFYFIGALVLIEKREGVLDALLVTPLGLRGYLLSKAASLTLLATLASGVVVGFTHGTRVAVAPLLAGVALTASLFVLVGVAAVARFDTVNRYFFGAVLYGAVLYARPSRVSRRV